VSGAPTVPGSGWTRQEVSDLVFYGAIGAVIGGRIGYVFFYGFGQFLSDPLWLLRIWDGGMSFHGGLLGVAAAVWWFGRKPAALSGRLLTFGAPMVPIGLGLGAWATSSISSCRARH
jgi:phosphatidylglycerol---prolipoprotein diacylglyceryl transferase